MKVAARTAAEEKKNKDREKNRAKHKKLKEKESFEKKRKRQEVDEDFPDNYNTYPNPDFSKESNNLIVSRDKFMQTLPVEGETRMRKAVNTSIDNIVNN